MDILIAGASIGGLGAAANAADPMRLAFHDRDIAGSRIEWRYPCDPLRVDLVPGAIQ